MRWRLRWLCLVLWRRQARRRLIDIEKFDVFWFDRIVRRAWRWHFCRLVIPVHRHGHWCGSVSFPGRLLPKTHNGPCRGVKIRVCKIDQWQRRDEHLLALCVLAPHDHPRVFAITENGHRHVFSESASEHCTPLENLVRKVLSSQLFGQGGETLNQWCRCWWCPMQVDLGGAWQRVDQVHELLHLRVHHRERSGGRNR